MQAAGLCCLVFENCFVRERWCMCMCLPLGALITSHMKYIRNNWIKQLYSFMFLYMTLAVDKFNVCGLSNSARHEQLSKNYQTVATIWSISVIKVSWRMCSDAFKSLQLHNNNFGLKQISSIV